MLPTSDCVAVIFHGIEISEQFFSVLPFWLKHWCKILRYNF